MKAKDKGTNSVESQAKAADADERPDKKAKAKDAEGAQAGEDKGKLSRKDYDKELR